MSDRRLGEAPRAAGHTWHTCDCGEGPCNYCGGGLASCDVCHGAEGALPTDCPGVAIEYETLNRIHAGEIDYRADRGWIAPDGEGNSMGDWRIQAAAHRAAK